MDKLNGWVYLTIKARNRLK